METLKTICRKFWLPVILIAGLIAFFATGANEAIGFASIAANYTMMKSFVAAHQVVSYLGFTLLYVVAVAFSLPIALPLTLTGGAIFGWPAVLLVVVGATVGATILFIAARSVFQDMLQAKAGPFLARLEAGFSQNAFFYLLALRLVPAAPFWVVNIVPAMTRMKLGPYVVATFIGILPGSAVFISVGRGFDHILAAGRTPDLTLLSSPQILGPLAALGALALLPVVIRWWRAKHRQDPT